jgi:hypothetical protein
MSVVEVDRRCRRVYFFHHYDNEETVHMSETSVYLNEITRRYSPEVLSSSRNLFFEIQMIFYSPFSFDFSVEVLLKNLVIVK